MLGVRVKGGGKRRRKGCKDWNESQGTPENGRLQMIPEEGVEPLRTTVLEKDSWHAMVEQASLRYQELQENAAWNQTMSRVQENAESKWCGVRLCCEE